jgi:uncharacterized protein
LTQIIPGLNLTADVSFQNDASATVVIGSDCPGLTPDHIASAFERLEEHRAVFGPAEDGGYYLVGLAQAVPEFFREVSWGTGTVLAESLAIAKRLGIQSALLESLPDVDVPADLIHWQRVLQEEEENSLNRISVIIPTLNEGPFIAKTLRAVLACNPYEVILVDGGSTDDTVQAVASSGATVVQTPPGRARQMNAGAAQATGEVLLFLHGDTLLPQRWPTVVQQCLNDKGVVAGAFSLGINGRFAGRRLVEKAANARSQWLQRPYGDQGLFLRRSLFEELGGFANLPLLEDYEMNQRLRQCGGIVTAPEAVLTSGRRWERLGVLNATWINQMMIVGYRLGVNPERLAAYYRRDVTSR